MVLYIQVVDTLMDEGILRLIEGMEGVIDCRAYTFVDSRQGDDELRRGVSLVLKSLARMHFKTRNLEKILRRQNPPFRPSAYGHLTQHQGMLGRDVFSMGAGGGSQGGLGGRGSGRGGEGKGWRKGYKGSFHTGLGVAGLKHDGKGLDLQRRSELRTKYRDFEKSIRTVRDC